MLLVWCFFSLFWSEHPAITFRRSLLLILNVTTLMMLVSILSAADTKNLLTKILNGLILASIITVPFFSGAVHSETELMAYDLVGNWKGVFPHKNVAGTVAVFSIFFSIYQYMILKKRIWLYFVCTSCFFIYFTHSKTALVLLLPSLMAGYLVFKCLNNKKLIKLIAIVLLITFLSCLIFYQQLISLFMSILDNPEAFTGRATIWSLLVQLINDNVLLGIGYGAVWRVGDDMLIVEYATGWVDWVYTLTHGHNGYLDMLASVGFIGFMLAFYTLFYKPVKELLLCKSIEPAFYFLCFATIFFFSIHNMLESNTLNPDSGRWYIYLCILFLINYHNSDSSEVRCSGL
jgi:O-antigen ligase